MSVKEQLTVASGLAVLLAMTALFPIYQGASWWLPTTGGVLAVVLTGMACRRTGVPRPLQPVLALLVLTAYLAVVFAGSTLSYGVVPTSRTLDLVRALVQQGTDDVQAYGPPVPVSEGLRLLTAAGVGAIAVLVDLVAVVLERAAVSGLPLLALLAVPSAVLPDGVGAGWFVLGTIGWLGLLLVEGSERVGRWGTPMRSALPGARPGGDDSSLGRVGRRIGFAAVGAAVLIPWATPGLDQRLVGGNGSGPGEGSGDGPRKAQTYNAITKLQGYLSKTRIPLFEYVTTDNQPDYIRMTTLDTYSDGAWSATTLNANPKSDRVNQGVDPPNGETGPHREFTTTVALYDKALDVRWLPVPYGVRKVDVGKSWLWEARSQTVFSAAQKTTDLDGYKVSADRPLPDRESLRAAGLDDVDGEVRSHYGQPLKVAPYVRTVTQSVVRGKDSEYDRAVAIQDYFSRTNGYEYSLSVPKAAPGQDKLEAFLRNKQGFCEQYATAMAAMLRVAGVPSRVAVGFTAGTRTVAKDGTVFYVVTTKEAHAWPEAWFAGTGWVRFEPTPGASQAVVPAYTAAAVVDPRTGQPAASPTPTAAPGASPTATISPTLDRIKDADARADQQSGGGGSLTTTSSLLVYLPLLLALLLVAPLGLTWLRRRSRWSHPGALTAWDQLLDDAADVGLTWRASDSPRAAAARLTQQVRLPAPALEALDRIARAAERARYAPPSRSGPEDLARASGVVRKALHDQAPFTVRTRSLLFPPSTLRWATGSVGGALSRAMDAVDDAISAVTRPIRKRATAR